MTRWIRLSGCCALALLTMVAAQARDGVQVAEELSLLRADLPGVQVYQSGLDIERVYGIELAEGVTPYESSESFVVNHTHVFGAEADDLVLAGFEGADPAQPVMWDAATGTYKFYLYSYAQQRDGVPVFRSDLRVLVRNMDGYPTVLAASSLKDLGDFTPSRAALDVRYDLAEAAVIKASRTGFNGEPLDLDAPLITNFSAPEHVIWVGTGKSVAAPRMAVTYIGDNYDDQDADRPEKWLFVADATTGEILLAESQIYFTDVTGNVSGRATTLPKSAPCNPEVVTPMSYARVTITGGSSAYADINGNFTISNGGSSAVTVQSFMAGLYFTVDNVAGGEETLSQSVTPPGPANFMHNDANSAEFVRAQINGYVQANVVRKWTLDQNPSYPVVATQTNFPINVNRNDLYCPANAWYDGSSLNFCQASGSYPNTAFSNVLHHEYGHHLVEVGGSGQDAYGEGMGDCVAMLIANDPVLGYGFEGNCNAGIRTADNNYQYPCTGEIHECGQLLSGCIWSTREYLQVTEPADYLAIISNLTANSILLHSGGSITPSITIDFLTLDDDDANLENGTPHYDEIIAGFGDHNMWAGPPPENDDCGGAERACPGTYSYGTDGMTNDGSASCGTSSSSPDVWYRYTPVSNGTLTLDLCDSDYDTVVSVHTGCPGTSSNEIGCNDDTSWFGDCGFFPTSQSYLEVSVSAGNTYYIRISGYEGATGGYVMALSGPNCAAEDDLDPPSPDPMTFSAAPAPASASSIGMTATTATDVASPPVQYQFDFLLGGAGGSDSGWQASPSYIDGGLSPNTSYSYRVRARDSASTPNETDYSGDFAAITWANTPAAPSLSGGGAGGFNLDVNANGNPAYTEYAIQCVSADPADAIWQGKYAAADGTPAVAAVWRTDSQWGVLAVKDLADCTEYSFAVKARNLDLVETGLGAAASMTTLLTGDLDGDGDVDLSDLSQLLAHYGVTSGAAYGDGDLDGDGDVDLSDLSALLAVYGGGC